MRFSNQRVSPIKRQINNQTMQCRNYFNYRLQSDKFYMHYNNAIYMGGMMSYKRNGQGIMLLDDGTSVITDYCYDSMVGHNILYRENAIISVLFIKTNSFEIVVRTGQCIFKLPFYQQEQYPSGNGLLIDFQSKKIYHLIYQSGRLVKKIVESNRDVIQKVFSYRLTSLLDIRHEQAFKFTSKFDNGIKILKQGKKIIIGYVNSRNILDGICFKLKIDQDFFDDFSYPLEMKCIERGFYHQDRLQNFGERYFSNGNLYLGEFNDDSFHGKGLLIYPQQSKWVFGHFQGERLKKMISMSIGQNRQGSNISLKKNMKQIHQFNTKNWMSVDVQMFSWQILTDRFGQAEILKITDVAIQKQRQIREQQERLYLIEEHFKNQQPNSQIDRFILQQMNKNKLSPQKIIINQYSSLKPKVLEIQPRCTENQDYWSNIKHKNYNTNTTFTPKNLKINTQKCLNTTNGFNRTPKAQKTYSPAARNTKSPFKKLGGDHHTKKYFEAVGKVQY